MDADTRRWLEKLELKQDSMAEDLAHIRGVLDNGIVRKPECAAWRGGTDGAIGTLKAQLKTIIGFGVSLVLLALGGILTLILRE